MARSRVADYETTGRLKIILEEAAYEASSTSPRLGKICIGNFNDSAPKASENHRRSSPISISNVLSIESSNRKQNESGSGSSLLAAGGGREKRWRREFVGRILDKNPTTFRGGSGGFSNGAGIKLQGGEGKIPRQEEGEQVGFDVP